MSNEVGEGTKCVTYVTLKIRELGTLLTTLGIFPRVPQRDAGGAYAKPSHRQKLLIMAMKEQITC